MMNITHDWFPQTQVDDLRRQHDQFEGLRKGFEGVADDNEKIQKMVQALNMIC